MDGEAIDVPEGSFDAVLSRVGLIYFPDQHAALKGMHRALKPGGRVGAIVYSTAERNAFFSLPVSSVRRRLGLPPPRSGQPGPFSLGAPEVIEAAYVRAGFRDVRVEIVDAPLRMADAAACVRFERESFAALHQMLSSLDEHDRASAWEEIEGSLRRFEGANGFVGPCELVVAVGTK
jgi:SAM-dependent methyltransferase